MFKVESEYDDLDKYKDNNENIYYRKKNTGTLHNSYGQAVISKDGSKFYYIEGMHHRLDGPAVIYPNGGQAYYIKGELLDKEEFEMHPERLKYLGKEYLICLK